MNNLLPEELRSFEYYKRKLPLYLQNSYGFIEHFRIWYDLMISANQTESLVNVANVILYLMNIFDPDYLTFIRDLENSGSQGTTDYGDTCDMLDKIGSLFGVNRNIAIEYEEDGSTINEELSLNNEEYLLLIKGQIIRDYCEGTWDQINQFYNEAGLQVFLITLPQNATCLVSLANVDPPYSSNIQKLFKSGNLRIESMGIKYLESVTIMGSFLRWDSSASQEVWDTGVWSE